MISGKIEVRQIAKIRLILYPRFVNDPLFGKTSYNNFLGENPLMGTYYSPMGSNIERKVVIMDCPQITVQMNSRGKELSP